MVDGLILLFLINNYSRSVFTHILVWTVFMDYHDLAKVVWRKTQHPIHCAILVCNLYLTKLMSIIQNLFNDNLDTDIYLTASLIPKYLPSLLFILCLL